MHDLPDLSGYSGRYYCSNILDIGEDISDEIPFFNMEEDTSSNYKYNAEEEVKKKSPGPPKLNPNIDIERISPFFYDGDVKKFKNAKDIRRIFNSIRNVDELGMYRSYKNMAMVYHIATIKDLFTCKEIRREIHLCRTCPDSFTPSLGLTTKTIKNLIGYYNTPRMKSNVVFLSELTSGGSDRGEKFM